MNELKEMIADVSTPYEMIKGLRKLETENLIKNNFLLELKEKLHDTNNESNDYVSIMNFIEMHIDGIPQTSIELSNINCTINLMDEVIHKINE